jgi:gliding motility-associated-like protein
VSNQPLSLKARNIGNAFEWRPSSFLDNAKSNNPVFRGQQEQMYGIRITNPSGCITIDSQLVRMFPEREIYVPTAFTPNGDGRNDYIFPYLVGIKELKHFRVINRWGVVVFEAHTDLPGWDGRYQGKPQPMQGYVWEALGIDLEGKNITRKGSFTLIR